jgi:phage-related protein
MSEEWSVEYYVEEASGKVPVREFLNALDKKTHARFQWSLEALRTRNIYAREPLVKHIEDDIWELREESNTNIYRILYVFFTGRRIILLHGFQKQGQKMPRRELETAKRRLKEFKSRERGE